MFLVYSPDYHFVSLGDHVFPMLKYEAVYRELRARGGFEFLVPDFGDLMEPVAKGNRPGNSGLNGWGEGHLASNYD